jgi:thymidine kinase
MTTHSKIPVIFTGPMGAGKTLSLIKKGRLYTNNLSNESSTSKTLLIKYSKDKRFTSDPCLLQSHDKDEWFRSTYGIMVEDMKEILNEEKKIKNNVSINKEEKENIPPANIKSSTSSSEVKSNISVNINTNEVKSISDEKDSKSVSILNIISECDTILIDEAQFIGNVKLFIIKYSGTKNIFISCLNSSFKQEVFPNLVEILPYCIVEYCIGKCDRCGKPAIFNVRLNKNDTSLVSIGGKDQYETRCKECIGL